MNAISSALVAGLDDEQRAAVLAGRGPVCVLAGAGTGKTRTITHRIAHLVASGHVAASQVLAVTFTARAAGEMRGRLRALESCDGGVARLGSVQALTFHAAARRQLQYFWPRVVGGTGWQLLDSKFAIVAQAANRARVGTGTDTVRDLAGEIEWAKASLITPEGYAAAAAKTARDVPMDAAQIATVYANYESLKARGEVALLDFDDLLLHTAAAIENDAAVAGEFRDRYRCFVVDEFQDVTPLQHRVLTAWLGERDDLTVVGDANQTIYSFTGATPNYLLDFSRRYPEATVVRLERDYRSTPQVVSLANRVIGAARGRVAGSRLQLIGQRPPGPEPTFDEYPDEVAEATGVARAIAALIEAGTEPAEIAVLYRINAQSEVYEEALTAASIPFQVRGGEGFFSRQEICLLYTSGARRRRPHRAGPPARLAGADVLAAGRVRGGRRILRDLRGARDPRGDRHRRHRRALPGQPAVAVPAVADGGLPRPRRPGPGVRLSRRRDRRGPLVQPRAGVRGAGRRGLDDAGVDRRVPAARRGVDRPGDHRVLGLRRAGLTTRRPTWRRGPRSPRAGCGSGRRCCRGWKSTPADGMSALSRRR